MAEKFYLTSAITYTSGKPHIGNTYEIILSDAIARFKKTEGYDVYFMTGTDEHGQKVEIKAEERGVTPKQFVDEVSDEIKRLWRLVGADYDKFIRTTDDYHERQVQKIFKKFYDNGDIYKGSYEGLYCTPCESFWTESQLVNGKCPDCGREVKPAREEAYFFKMGKYAGRLVEHIIKHPEFIQPVSRKNEMMNNFLLPDELTGATDEEILKAVENGTFKSRLQDLCVSRTTFKWGVPVDFDKKHVVYVWLDALTNYINGIGYDADGNSSELYKKLWPADVHIIGKDIIRFHTVYWPIFLMALGEPLPKCVFGHPWLLQGGEKMSKSRGNVIYADDLASVFGADSVRYYVLHEMPFASDGVITWELVCERHNSDLANTLGNLVKRTIAMANKYFGGKVVRGEAAEEDKNLISVVTSVRDRARSKMDGYRVADAMDEVWSIFRRANKYIDETAPWILEKDADKRERLNTVIYNLLESINIGANLAYAFIPETAVKILAQLGAERRAFADLNKFGLTAEYSVTGSPETLFARLNREDVERAADKIAEEQCAENEPAEQLPDVPLITIDDFAKIRMQVGTVTACEPVKKSRLLHETVKVGNKTLSVLSGIAAYYTAEEMVGKKVIVVTNLPPREMKGLVSEGMIVCAQSPDGKLSVVSPERDMPDGSLLS